VTLEKHEKPKKKKEKEVEKPIEKDDDSSEDDGFEIVNPNREKPLKKANVVEINKKVKDQLDQEKQDRKQIKLMKEGKTEQAKAELAKLEEVRKRREEAKKEKEEGDKLKKEKENVSKGKKNEK